MYKAKVEAPTGEVYNITAPSEWELHRKVQKLVGRVNASKISTTPLKGGHTLIKGGGWQITLYCSGW